LMKLARISLNGALIYAHEVHEHDDFQCSLGDEKRLRHEPDPFSDDRGEIVGYYAVIKTAETADFETMSIAQVHAIRDRSDGWVSFQSGRIKSTPWSTDEVEMAKKTVIRRLMKRQPQSRELALALAVEDRAEFPQFEKRPPGRPAKNPEPPALTAPPEQADPPDDESSPPALPDDAIDEKGEEMTDG